MIFLLRVPSLNETNEDNIQVELTVMSENYTQSVDIAFSSNQAPDVLRLKSANTSGFVKKGYLAPIDEYLTDDMNTKFGSLLIDEVNRFDGKVYTLANTGLTLRLVYNKDLFAKAGIENPPVSLQESENANYQCQCRYSLQSTGCSEFLYVSNQFSS